MFTINLRHTGTTVIERCDKLTNIDSLKATRNNFDVAQQFTRDRQGVIDARNAIIGKVVAEELGEIIKRHGAVPGLQEIHRIMLGSF